MAVDANLVSALAAVLGVVVGLVAQVAVLTKRNRLRAKLRQAIELRRDLEGEASPGRAMLQQSLDAVAEHCAKELAIQESRWVLRASTTGSARLELVISLAGVLVAAGLLGMLFSWFSNVAGIDAVIIGFAVTTAALVWILWFEGGLKRDIALAEMDEVTVLRGRWLRYAAAVDEDVLMAHPADAVRFTRIGLLLYMVPLATLLSTLTFPGVGSLGWTIAIVLPILFLFTFSTNRQFNEQHRSGRSSWLHATPLIILGVIQGFISGEIVSLRAFAGPIEGKLNANDVQLDERHLLVIVDTFDQLASEDVRFLVGRWVITIIVVAIGLLPMMLRLLGGNTRYDHELRSRLSEAHKRHAEIIRRQEEEIRRQEDLLSSGHWPPSAPADPTDEDDDPQSAK